MTERYSVSRSNTNKNIHLVCGDERFYKDIPHEILHLGPWQGGNRGDVIALRPHIRAMLAEQKFVLVYCHLKDLDKHIIAQ